MLLMIRYCILPGTVRYGTVLTYSHSPLIMLLLIMYTLRFKCSFYVHIYTLIEARRHAFESGLAEVRARHECGGGGRAREGGVTPSRKGGLGSPPIK